MNRSRPVSIWITQILMLFSLVPMTLGLTFSFLRALVLNPWNLLSVRAVGFLTLAFGLVAIFLIYGVGGLWKQKRYGYWLGILFLALVNLKNIYMYAPTMYRLLASNELRSDPFMILDVVLQSVMVVLLLALLLKVSFGKEERAFFNPSLDEDRANSQF
jgi:hypothetical protein